MTEIGLHLVMSNAVILELYCMLLDQCQEEALYQYHNYANYTIFVERKAIEYYGESSMVRNSFLIFSSVVNANRTVSVKQVLSMI